METFINEINRQRKLGGWYFWSGKVNGKMIHLKGFKTWLQKYEVDGIDWSNCMERKVKEFQEDLKAPFV